MDARAIWNGILRIGSAGIPVKLYSAVQDRDIHSHLLQKRGKSPVKQHLVLPGTGKPAPRQEVKSQEAKSQEVKSQEIKKGYEVEAGRFIILEEHELAQLKPQESREINILRFVPSSGMGHEWYERPYYLSPNPSPDLSLNLSADDVEDSYFALVEAIRELAVLGVARWTMRGKSSVGALRAEGDYLALIKLRYSQEILAAPEFPSPGFSSPTKERLDRKELRMAEELVGALAGKFEPEQFQNEYRQRLGAFIEAKARGEKVAPPSVKERVTSASLEDQLTTSLTKVKRKPEKTLARI